MGGEGSRPARGAPAVWRGHGGRHLGSGARRRSRPARAAPLPAAVRGARRPEPDEDRDAAPGHPLHRPPVGRAGPQRGEPEAPAAATRRRDAPAGLPAVPRRRPRAGADADAGARPGPGLRCPVHGALGVPSRLSRSPSGARVLGEQAP